jgi:diguanylate cyclase (GGDEF)-like protein/PAS domain S-box-containing protein
MRRHFNRSIVHKFTIILSYFLLIFTTVPAFSSDRNIVTNVLQGFNLSPNFIHGIYVVVILFAFSLSLLFFVMQKMTKRLRELVQVFTTVASGKKDIRAIIDKNDEVGLLAKSLNTMLDELSTTEYQREQITRFYSAWVACNDLIVRGTKEDVLLSEICHIIANQVAFKLTWIGFINPQTQEIDIVASNNLKSKYLQKLRISSNASISEGQGATGQAIRSNQPVIFNDLLHEHNAARWWDIAREENIHASAAFPITRSGQVIGAMCLYSTQVNYFSEELISLIRGLIEDISYALENLERKKIQICQDHELRIAAAAFESQESFMVTDGQGLILRVNNGFTALTGYTANEVIGKNPRLLSSGRHSKEFYVEMWDSLKEQRFWQGEIWNRKKNGYIFPEWLCITAIANSVGEIVNYVATSNDISQRKSDEERIRQLAFYDELTKLPNRALLFQRLNLALNTSQRYRKYGALIFLDLDHFKILNDTLGHTLGDQLLLEVSKRLLNCVRNIDTVARLGGDEFIIILEHLGAEELPAAIQVNKVAEKIRSSIAECYLLNIDISDSETVSTIEYHTSCSVGFVMFSGSDVGAEELLKYADLAMYHSKKMGRNHISSFEPTMQKALMERTQLEADLRQSIVNGGEFELHYQAQVDCDGKILGAEALLRWNHPVRGRVNPADFIPLAEETGMIVAVGTWVLEKGCETLAQWAKNPQTQHLKLAINVSSRQLSQDNFVHQVIESLALTGANPYLLKLEITESMVVDNVQETITKMHELKELGISFSMDDFGTGYSSLSYLQKLPLDQLKIDQSFVRNLSFDGHDSAIVKTIINLGENLSLNIIAEGVETKMQCDYLSNFGCLIFQGYLFSRPLPEDEFMAMVNEKATVQ